MAHRQRLQALSARLIDARAEAETVSGKHALEMFPALRPDGVEVGVYEPGAADIDSNMLLNSYVRGARDNGAKVLTGATVSAIGRRAGGWTVTTSQESFEANVIVNAAGAWVDQIAAAAQVAPIGIRPMRRTAFTFAAPAHFEVDRWPHIFKIDRHWYLKPETGRFMGSLAEEVLSPPSDVYPDDIDIAQAIENIEADTSLTVGRPTASWAGLRNFLADRNPVGGARSADPSFVWVAGQGGCGVLTSPALGQAAAAAALGRALPDSLSAFGIDASALSPDRLAAAGQ
jgi:D-arginine dehydrogenase